MTNQTKQSIQTNRQTFHDERQNPQTPMPSPLLPFKGADSYADSVGSGAEAATPTRISQRQLEEIAPTLSERDRQVLSALRHCRYLMTRQTQRLYYRDAATPAAALRATTRGLNKLKELRLIDSLERRIGGVRAGSGSLIWYLTPAGERMLRLGDDGPHSRKRFMEPSPHFLAHTLSVAECYIQLTEICSGDGLSLSCVEMETDCWRSFSHRGKVETLRPDLFAITNCDDYEDRWFFEVDLKTESPVTVIEKCRRYHEYYRSGLEQKQHEVFPLTVWIVPDAARKESIVSHIRAEFVGAIKLFIVITPDELKPLLRQGMGKGELC